jgi:hypothetical protein
MSRPVLFKYQATLGETRMHLTNRAAWHIYAGGTCARDDKYGYDAFTTIGRYTIQPISSENNVNRHIGYIARFLNEKGKLTGGLWQDLHARPTTLPNARRLCRNHAEANGGTLILEQLPQ